MATDDVLQRVASTIAAHRKVDPVQSYVATLFAKGNDAIIKKIGEEATEAVMAAKDGDKIRLTAELADLWFHCLVLLESMGPGGNFRPRREGRARLRPGPVRFAAPFPL